MFPYIMITITIVFFREEFHLKIINRLKKVLSYRNSSDRSYSPVLAGKSFLAMFCVYFVIQVCMPLRYLLYPGKLFWTEQGYRFSWRVMLMEKAGSAFFYVRDKSTGKETMIDNKEYLTYMQEKMMATQPDMMVDYAKFLKHEFIARGYKDPMVRAESFVTVNGSGSRAFIDPEVDLSVQSNSIFKNHDWVKSY